MEARDEQSRQSDLLSCDQVHERTCTYSMVSRYRKRISGPLLVRIDIHLEVPQMATESTATDPTPPAKKCQPNCNLGNSCQSAKKSKRDRVSLTGLRQTLPKRNKPGPRSRSSYSMVITRTASTAQTTAAPGRGS
jgi:hypothetical protein